MPERFVVAIGEVLAEIMALDPGRGFREPIRLVGPFPSGAPAIFLDQAAKMGTACGMISCVGKDDFGLLNVERLRNDGVDVSAIAVHPEAATGTAFVRYRDDGSRDFVFNIRHSACGRIQLDAAARVLLARATHLHVMGSSLYAPEVVNTTRKAIGIVKAKGGTVSFDPNIRKEMLGHEGVREALEYALSEADLFLPSGEELLLFTKSRNERRAIDEILEGGVRAVVMKRGAAGASYFDRSEDIHVSGCPVAEIDPTGAGDCFGATFVSCWLSGKSPADALRFANASGAIAVSRKGPMEGTSTRAEVLEFLAGADAREGL